VPLHKATTSFIRSRGGGRLSGVRWAHAKREVANRSCHFKLGDRVSFVNPSAGCMPYYRQSHADDAGFGGYDGTVVKNDSEHYATITLKGSAFRVLLIHLRFVERLPYQTAKLLFLFPLETKAIHKRMLYDSVSLYSTTDHLSAIEIAKHTLSMENVSKGSIILDATACIGGNTYAFAKLFKHVHAVEIDHSRATMLKHNMTVLAVDSTVTVHEGDFCVMWRSLVREFDPKDAVVFIDPPWGGINYKYRRTISLKLGDYELSDLCLELDACFKALVIKVPYNYDYAHFKSVHPRSRCIDITPKIKLILLNTTY
jgi:hypothetical protein